MYGLKRLVRGLASGRQGARQGNALALSKLLADLPALSINEVLATMASELEVSGQAKVSFKLHHSKGQVFPEHASIVLMRQAQLQGWPMGQSKDPRRLFSELGWLLGLQCIRLTCMRHVVRSSSLLSFAG